MSSSASYGNRISQLLARSRAPEARLVPTILSSLLATGTPVREESESKSRDCYAMFLRETDGLAIVGEPCGQVGARRPTRL